MDGEGPFDDLEGNAAFARLFQKFLAQYGSQLLQNNEFLESANAAGSGVLNLLKADASNNTVLNALTGKVNSFRVNDVEIANVGAGGNTSSNYLLTDGSQQNYPLSVYSAGTAYTLTAVSAALDFGTTDPSLVLNKAGTYLLLGRVNLQANAATFAASRTVTLKLRRTNNTPADLISQATATPIITTQTQTIGVFNLPPVIYTTAVLTDAITIFGDVSVIPSAGTLTATEASIVAIRLY
jgi:hypothetical protein